MYTHANAPNIGWGHHANAPNKSTICMYIFTCVCVCVCAQVVQRVRAFYLGCIITKTVGTSVTAVAEQHAAAAHQSFGID
jgi:hypothetical protein